MVTTFKTYQYQKGYWYTNKWTHLKSMWLNKRSKIERFVGEGRTEGNV